MHIYIYIYIYSLPLTKSKYIEDCEVQAIIQSLFTAPMQSWGDYTYGHSIVLTYLYA